MNTYRLIPKGSGSHWGLSKDQGEAIVRARTTGEARALASLAEAEAIAPAGNVTSYAARSAFRNPLLYGMLLDNDTGFSQDGEAGVLMASFYSPSDVEAECSTRHRRNRGADTCAPHDNT